MAPPLVRVALRFGPPEYFSLMLLGFVILTYLAQKSMIKALLTAGVGVVLGTIGLDTMTGMPRFTFNIPELLDGVGLAPLAMGLFGISEILLNVEKKIKQELLTTKVKGLFPTLEDWRRSIWAILRGTGSGFFLGILPGGGAVLGSFVSYALEKRISKNPEEFGKGAIEGVAAPESANNSAAQGAFIPLLTLGIPANVVMAILLGALMIHNITPGPMLVKEHPQLFWGVISSMYLGNIMLLVLNLPLIGLWVQLLRVPYSLLFPLILFICLIGAYVINNSAVDVMLMFIFGVVGYFMRKFEYEPAPMVLAYVLTPLLENALRQSLILSDGSFGIFMSRPISAGCLIIAAALLLSSLLPMIRKKRETLVADAEKDE
jgi:putative tricarboxylic transport membrane protein